MDQSPPAQDPCDVQPCCGCGFPPAAALQFRGSETVAGLPVPLPGIREAAALLLAAPAAACTPACLQRHERRTRGGTVAEQAPHSCMLAPPQWPPCGPPPCGPPPACRTASRGHHITSHRMTSSLVLYAALPSTGAPVPTPNPYAQLRLACLPMCDFCPCTGTGLSPVLQRRIRSPHPV